MDDRLFAYCSSYYKWKLRKKLPRRYKLLLKRISEYLGIPENSESTVVKRCLENPFICAPMPQSLAEMIANKENMYEETFTSYARLGIMARKIYHSSRAKKYDDQGNGERNFNKNVGFLVSENLSDKDWEILQEEFRIIKLNYGGKPLCFCRSEYEKELFVSKFLLEDTAAGTGHHFNYEIFDRIVKERKFKISDELVIPFRLSPVMREPVRPALLRFFRR